MHLGGGHFGKQHPAQSSSGTPAALALAGFFLIATLLQWCVPGSPLESSASEDAVKTGWLDLCALHWNRVWDRREWWRLLTYCAVHHSLWHAVAGAIGLYVAGRAVEPIIGQTQVLCTGLLGTVTGAFTSCGLGAFIALAQPVGNQHGSLGTPEAYLSGAPLAGTFPMVTALIGVYSTILPGWRMGAASRWRVLCPLTAGAFGWLAAICCAFWWASGWFPEAGPAPMLAGLFAGWAFARFLGFGQPLLGQHRTQLHTPEARQIEEMNWEEFLTRELDPVLEKISTQGISSLTRAEWKILQQSRRKLEGW
jgi:membrane associated rhomboid family serine protease